MSDHIDGPRTIGDPTIDLTDLFAFTSPENPARTVLAANVFPSAGADAVFTNAAHHAIIVRRVSMTGLGHAAGFKAGDKEIRFDFRFDMLVPQPSGGRPVQQGTCTLPDGRALRFVVNDEKGASTSDGVFRVFAGLRSDPFFLAWLLTPGIKPFQNLLQHDNVLTFLVEFDSRRVLELDQGSLFGIVAETTPTSPVGPVVGRNPLRFDWVGRPEQTNMRLNNSGLTTTDDLRDLWNQQKPFEIAEDLRPLFRKRLIDSLAEWDMRDGKADWTAPELAASANVFLDDFTLIDVAKPVTDASHLEIEKSTLKGRAYETGGGRTVNSNVIDILLNWMVKHDRGDVLTGGATVATKPGTKEFPYLASPNTQLQTVAESVDLPVSPDHVWALIGQFGDVMWHPLIARIRLTGAGPGQLRTMETIDGKQMIERLEALDSSQRLYRYAMIRGIPAADYTGVLDVKPKGAGSSVAWRVQYRADGQPDIVARTIISTILKTGLESLKPRFGVPR